MHSSRSESKMFLAASGAFIPATTLGVRRGSLQQSLYCTTRTCFSFTFARARRVRHNKPPYSTVVCVARPTVGKASPEITMDESLRDGYNQSITVDGCRLSFDYFSGDPDRPVIFFLQGFYYSRHRRAKANALEIFAKRGNYSFLVCDYCGTGLSEGDFVKDGTLSLWISHALALMDFLLDNRPVVVCGAGIGGWIMLHVAQMRRNVVGLVGVNASVDFTEDLIVPGLSEAQREEIEEKGFVDMPWGRTSYPIGRALIDDAVQWLCLRGGDSSLPIACPVHFLQGLSDEEVVHLVHFTREYSLVTVFSP